MKIAQLSLLMSVVCSGAIAEPFSYRYVELGYFNQTDHVGGVSGNDKIESDGYDAKLSADFSNIILQLQHSEGDVNRVFGINPSSVGLDLGLKSTGVFVGGHGEPNEKTSFFGGFGYDHSKLDTNVGDSSTEQYRFGGGVRYWVVPHVEVNASLFYIHSESNDSDATDNDGSVSIGARFQPVDLISVGANYLRLVDANSDAYTIDARLQF